MHERLVKKKIKATLKEFPGVVLLGPRQCGKTTLAKDFTKNYYDLEKSEDQLRLEANWSEIVFKNELVVLDEAQAYPDVFPRIRSAIDERRKKNGRFLMLGSVSPVLMRDVSDSLAGRVALLEMTPFAFLEMEEKKRNSLWLYGGYPDGGILKKSRFFTWQDSYLSLLAQRDLPQWGLPAKPSVTLRFFRMLAATHAQNWNAAALGASLGISYHTVSSYLDFLVEAFLIRSLPPYYKNLSKRVTKSPKVYWRDSGLLHTLLGFKGTEMDLLSQPWVGSSWEGWIIEQIISCLNILGISHQAYYLRVNNSQEIDLLLEIGGELFAIEIKLTSAPGSQAYQSLMNAADIVGARHRILISRTPKTIANKEFISTNLAGALEYLRKAMKKAR